ncbi:MAG: AraC-like DNA-binding protein [Pseudohongiellaceae bacterium]
MPRHKICSSLYTRGVRYFEIDPPLALRPSVRCLWLLEHDGGGQPERVLPDGCMEVVAHYGSPMQRQLNDGSFETQARTIVAGQLPSAMVLRASGPTGMVAARLQPWAAAQLMQDSARQLTSRVVPLVDLWGPSARHLEERVAAADHDGARFRLLADALLARLPQPRETSRLIGQAMGWIVDSQGSIAAREIARRLNWSPRTLERHFSTYVGLSPKALCRIERFQQLVQRLDGVSLVSPRPQHSPSHLAGLAFDMGYADQSHLAREFKQLAGVTATQYRAEQHGFSDCFTGP